MVDASMKINHEGHLLLEQSLLRVPHELLCRNFRPASKGITREHDYVVPALRDLTSAVENGASTQANTLESLDKMLERMKTIKHRLETLNRRDKRHLDKSGQRLRHLQDVYGIKDMGDPRYEAWAKIRLNRLLVDHLMREGYTDTAKRLTESTGVSDLVDLGIFEQCNQVTSKLEAGDMTAALQWCSENKLLLKKQRKTELEFQLRLQQYIEFVKKRDLVRARKHAMQYLSPASSEQGELAKHAAAMLVFQPSTEKEPYATYFSSARYTYLRDLFQATYRSLLSLPPDSYLHTSLTAGISALKNPSCHRYISSGRRGPPPHLLSWVPAVCPICSTELSELARDLPCACPSTSTVDPDPVALPNGRVYGLRMLRDYSRRNLGEEGLVKDPVTGEVFSAADVARVFVL